MDSRENRCRHELVTLKIAQRNYRTHVEGAWPIYTYSKKGTNGGNEGLESMATARFVGIDAADSSCERRIISLYQEKLVHHTMPLLLLLAML